MTFLKSKAPDFEDIGKWISSDAIEIDQGTFLLDFWSYTCRSCIERSKLLQRLNSSYSELEVIGVHSPRFDFESPEQVEKSVEKRDISYPVAVDSRKATTELYGASYQTQQVLVRDGEIIWKNIDEELGEMEENISEILDVECRGVISTGKGIDSVNEQYFGSEVGKEVNDVSNFHGQKTLEVPRNRKLEEVYLGGEWRQESKYLEVVGESRLFYSFSASELSIVAHPSGGIRDIEVLLNGEKVPEGIAGDDLRVDKGRSYLRVKRPDTYELIDGVSRDVSEVMLKPDKKTRLFALQLK